MNQPEQFLADTGYFSEANVDACRPQVQAPTLTEALDRLAHLLRELGATGREAFEVEGIMLLPGTAVMARVRGF